MNSLLKNIIRFALFLLLQIVVLNEVPPVHRFIIPYLYFLYILWLPFSINRFTLLIVAFFLGFHWTTLPAPQAFMPRPVCLSPILDLIY